jgi:hypothetical protein
MLVESIELVEMGGDPGVLRRPVDLDADVPRRVAGRRLAKNDQGDDEEADVSASPGHGSRHALASIC